MQSVRRQTGELYLSEVKDRGSTSSTRADLVKHTKNPHTTSRFRGRRRAQMISLLKECEGIPWLSRGMCRYRPQLEDPTSGSPLVASLSWPRTTMLPCTG